MRCAVGEFLSLAAELITMLELIFMKLSQVLPYTRILMARSWLFGFLRCELCKQFFLEVMVKDWLHSCFTTRET